MLHRALRGATVPACHFCNQNLRRLESWHPHAQAIKEHTKHTHGHTPPPPVLTSPWPPVTTPVICMLLSSPVTITVTVTVSAVSRLPVLELQSLLPPPRLGQIIEYRGFDLVGNQFGKGLFIHYPPLALEPPSEIPQTLTGAERRRFKVKVSDSEVDWQPPRERDRERERGREREKGDQVTPLKQRLLCLSKEWAPGGMTLVLDDETKTAGKDPQPLNAVPPHPAHASPNPWLFHTGSLFPGLFSAAGLGASCSAPNLSDLGRVHRNPRADGTSSPPPRHTWGLVLSRLLSRWSRFFPYRCPYKTLLLISGVCFPQISNTFRDVALFTSHLDQYDVTLTPFWYFCL